MVAGQAMDSIEPTIEPLAINNTKGLDLTFDHLATLRQMEGTLSCLFQQALST